MKNTSFTLFMFLVLLSVFSCRQDEPATPTVETTKQKMLGKWPLIQVTRRFYNPDGTANPNTTNTGGEDGYYEFFADNTTKSYFRGGRYSGTFSVTDAQTFVLNDSGGQSFVYKIIQLDDKVFHFQETIEKDFYGGKGTVDIECRR
jgi:hypothetical protein